MKKIISVILLVSLMAVIFCLSAQNADISGNSSHSVTRAIATLILPDFENLSETEQTDIVLHFDNAVRTLAHFLEYAALGFLALNCAYSFQKIHYKKSISCAFSVLYAVSDEIHQLFVPGRAFQFSDIIVDSLGATAGVFVYFLLFLLIIKLIKRHKTDS